MADKVVPPAPDTAHISVADVGEDMNPERADPVADLALDLSAFTVAETGAALVDKKEKKFFSVPVRNICTFNILICICLDEQQIKLISQRLFQCF